MKYRELGFELMCLHSYSDGLTAICARNGLGTESKSNVAARFESYELL